MFPFVGSSWARTNQLPLSEGKKGSYFPSAYHISCQRIQPGHSSSLQLGGPPGIEGGVSSVLKKQGPESMC